MEASCLDEGSSKLVDDLETKLNVSEQAEPNDSENVVNASNQKKKRKRKVKTNRTAGDNDNKGMLYA